MTISPLVLRLPVGGRWLARNSPANRVPSHGTHLRGTTFAIDFVSVGVLGMVVHMLDGEPDHVARRSQLALIL